MLADGSLRHLEELRKLQVGQPDGLIFKTDTDFGSPVIRLVDNDLRRFVYRVRLCASLRQTWNFAPLRRCVTFKTRYVRRFHVVRSLNPVTQTF